MLRFLFQNRHILCNLYAFSLRRIRGNKKIDCFPNARERYAIKYAKSLRKLNNASLTLSKIENLIRSQADFTFNGVQDHDS